MTLVLPFTPMGSQVQELAMREKQMNHHVGPFAESTRLLADSEKEQKEVHKDGE